MYRRIILSKDLSFKERLKRLPLYYLRRRGARIPWRKRFDQILGQNPAYAEPVDPSVEKAHQEYWKPFHKRINLMTLRISTNISGIADPRYVPEEIFKTDIEPTLQEMPSVEYLTNKSIYNHWHPGHVFPSSYFHHVDGEWLDKDLNRISFQDVQSIATEIEYPVVLKPNRNSYGGRNIHFPGSYDELICLVKRGKDFLVQEKIEQHQFFNQFNSHGLNTIRVNVYRSFKNNDLHVLNMALRMGVAGSLDNLSDGGIASMIRKNGLLNGFALDRYGTKHFKHPDTGVRFNKQIPDYERLEEISLKIAHKVFYSRLVALDLCYDKEGNWRAIEVNIHGNTLGFAQFHGALFFDEFTDEIRNYCTANHWIVKKSPKSHKKRHR